MVMDRQGRSHRAAGRPDGGQYERGGRGGGGDAGALLQLTPGEMRARTPRENVEMMGAEETLLLLQRAHTIYFTPDGCVMEDRDGRIIHRDEPGMPIPNVKVMQHDRRVQSVVALQFTAPMAGADGRAPSASQLRATIRHVNRYASAYRRRMALRESPYRHYLPGDQVARSLRAWKDRDAAFDVFRDIYHKDAGTARQIVCSGYPHTAEQANRFLNTEWMERDKKTGKPKTVTVTDEHGVEHKRLVPSKRGAPTRALLRMTFRPNNSTPPVEDVKRVEAYFRRLDDPQREAEEFWKVCYGNGSPVDESVAARPRRGRVNKVLGAWQSNRGQGNAARMLAYRKALSRDAAVAFLAMKPGDGRRANTQYTKRVRGKDGVMRDATPARLTEMRSWLHASYAIGSDEVDEYRRAHGIE